jgi:hypothetical protein
MSVRVEIDELQGHLHSFGSAPYLITTGADLVPHTTHVVVTLAGGAFSCAVGRKTAKNVVLHGAVCLLWPPYETGGFSLIVDGVATASDQAVTITPTAAVLHRNALAESGGYAADCAPLDDR